MVKRESGFLPSSVFNFVHNFVPYFFIFEPNHILKNKTDQTV